MRPTIILLALFGAAFAPAQEYQHIDFCEYWPLAVGNRWEYFDTSEAVLCADARQIDDVTVHRIDDRLHFGDIVGTPYEVWYMCSIVNGALYMDDDVEGVLQEVKDGTPFFPAEIYDGMPTRLQPYHFWLGTVGDLSDFMPYILECGVPMDTPAIWLAASTSDNGEMFALAKGYGPIVWETSLVVPDPANKHECGETTISARFHSSDIDLDGTINLDELLRAIQFYNTGGYNCAFADDESEDGYLALADDGNHPCLPHAADFAPVDWTISIDELLRVIQFFNAGGVYACPDEGTEDGYCAGLPG